MTAAFVSREDDLAALAQLLAGSTTKTVVISGETGVGKTTLASRLFQLEVEGGSSRFARHARVVAFRSGKWSVPIEDWLVARIGELLKIELSPNARPSEIVDHIVTVATSESVLLLLDNVESIDESWLDAFVRRWNTCGSDSKLLLTTSGPVWTPSALPEGTTVRELDGFADPSDVLTVLGRELTDRFPDDLLLREAGKLRNNPQSLMYLRLIQPRSIDDLVQLVDGLRDTSAELFGEIGLFDAIEARVGSPVIPFLALGRLLNIEIEEDLLASLWQALGGGSVERYIVMRDELLSTGLMSRVSGTPADRLAINPSVHIHLEKELLRRIGDAHVNHVDYYLSEYYRNRFERDYSSGLDDLGSYAYHSIACGNWKSAATYVTDEDRLKAIHNRGMAVQFRPILELLDQRLAEPGSSLSAPAALRAALAVELARCANDLSDHSRCLELLNTAELLLNQPGATQPVTRQFAPEIDYLRGISYSDIGQSLRCVESYLSVVAECGQKLDARGVLALGYMAFELRFHDIQRARVLGLRAVELARRSADDLLIARTACSLGQTEFFARSADARSLFVEAEAACRRSPSDRGDVRELGRVLIHSSMTYISSEDIPGAMTMLSAAQEINEQTGDRRRRASCLALKGVALFRRSRTEDDQRLARYGRSLLVEALDHHRQLGDWRNAIPEALSLAYIDAFATLEAAIEGARRGVEAEWTSTVRDGMTIDIAGCNESALDLFGRYWDGSFRPLLLEV